MSRSAAAVALSKMTTLISAHRLRVARGDTLGGLARREGVTLTDLARANGIRDVRHIRAGQVLVVPAHAGSTTPSAPSTASRWEPVRAAAPVGSNARTLLSSAQLHRIMPSLSLANASRYAPLLSAAMAEFGITTSARKAAFLAQVGHESAGLRYFEELASGAAYERRKDLGNVRPGDGRRFKGRGPIQLTGRANYRLAGRALGLDLENHPQLAARPDVGVRIAGWFWRRHGLNELADRGDFREITKRINGGFNGLADRRAYWARAKAVV